MQIREITIGELPGFVQSELWQQLQPKPITPLRAISQSLNPLADANDVVLIIAFEEKTLVALAGILPNYVNGQANQKAASNTCWWADADKGRQIAFPLLMKAFALYHERMFMTDLTPHTLSILEKTGRFDFPNVPYGIRGFLKFNLHEILPAKIPSAKRIKPLIHFSDHALNLLFSPFRLISKVRFGLKKVKANSPSGQAVFNRFSLWGLKDVKIETLDSIPPQLDAYIEKHSQNEFIRLGHKELEWIVGNPWIKNREKSTPADAFEYPFSYIVRHFEQYFLHISIAEKTIGLLLISIRDGHMKVPYAYFDEHDAPLVLKVIYGQALEKNAITLTIFRPSLVNVMRSAPHPFIFRKRIRRLVAISRQLTGFYHQYPELQDGDGDVVFT